MDFPVLKSPASVELNRMVHSEPRPVQWIIETSRQWKFTEISVLNCVKVGGVTSSCLLLLLLSELSVGAVVVQEQGLL